MKKVVFILVALMACSGAFAQSLKPTEDPNHFDLVFDSIQIPDTFAQQGLTPSFYMKKAAEARTISAAVGIGGGLLTLGVSKLAPEDIMLPVSIGIITGIATTVSYIVGLVYDNKAADAASKVKFVGNGVSISF